MTAIRALFDGLGRVMMAPSIVVAAAILMLIIAAPFAAVVGNQLQEALSNQPPISRAAGDVDPEWWYEYRQHATGLIATFTPAIIGFAAPLDNLSAMFDGTRRPIAVVGPFALALIGWSFLWGAALHRYAYGPTAGLLAAGARTFSRFFAISIAAAAVVIVLYLTIHPLLMGPLARATSPLLSYAIFGTMLAAIALIADYARVAVVMGRASSAAGALRAGSAFVRSNLGSILTLYVLTGLLFVALLAVYGVVDLYGGTRVAGWRGIAIAQAYIVARLVIRLTFGASEVRLYRALASRDQSPS